jgi:hypothetical protein
MYFPVALLQGSDDKMMLGMVAGAILILLIALGKRFFVALFEVITSPQASLGYHGKENTFLFSMFVVFLGGVLGLLYLTLQQPQISSDLSGFAKSTGQSIAQGNSNQTYRQISGEWAASRIDNALQTYVVGNFLYFPVLMVGIWFLNGLLFWLCSKMFGAQASLPAFLGALSWAYFFYGIANALSLSSAVKSITGSLFQQQPTPDMSIPVIVSLVLSLYAFILFCMGVVQAAEIGIGQLIVCILLIGIVVGGAEYYFFSQQFVPQASAFSGEITSYDPSQPGFTIGGGSYTPPADTGGSAPPAQSGLSGGDDEGPKTVGGDDSSSGASPGVE